MRIKYVKVSVEERLPEKGKNVIVLSADGKSGTCYFLSGLWHGQKNGEPKYWLEEVPDREAEMRETINLYKECFEQFIPTEKWDEATEFLSTANNGLAKDLAKREK